MGEVPVDAAGERQGRGGKISPDQARAHAADEDGGGRVVCLRRHRGLRAYKRFMTFLTHRGDAPALRYAEQPMHVLAGYEDRPTGFAAMQITVPAHFAGPIPHAHDQFDEAIYVLHGRLLVAGDDEPQEALAGSMFVAPRGQRHAFRNPHGTVAVVLGI